MNNDALYLSKLRDYYATHKVLPLRCSGWGFGRKSSGDGRAGIYSDDVVVVEKVHRGRLAIL